MTKTRHLFHATPTYASSVRASPTDVVAVLLVAIPNNFAGLAPLEVVRVYKGINEDNNVHEWRCEKMKNEACKVLDSFEVIAWQPEANAE